MKRIDLLKKIDRGRVHIQRGRQTHLSVQRERLDNAGTETQRGRRKAG